MSRFLVLMLCALVVLAGCGSGSSSDEDEDGHRFANEPRETAVSTATSEPTLVASSVQPTAEPTVSPAEALSVRGAPQFGYFLIDGHLNVYDTVARTFTPMNTPEGIAVLDFTSSPTGDRVAVLGMLNESVVVQFFGADSNPLGEPTMIPLAYMPATATPIASPAATPMQSRTPAALQINWVPQGNAVVLSGPGMLQRVSMSGVIMPISRAGVTGTVVNALWSPMDSQVAIMTQLMDGHQGVFMLNTGHAEARELDSLHLQPEQGLSNLQWLPNGLGLVMVVGNSSSGELMNGQLYVSKFDESVPTLVATSGQGGPGGTITHAVVSPDGHSVAYAIMVRDQGEWHLHSLWVKPLQGGPGYSVALQTNSPIVSIVWTAEGLVWQQEDGHISVVDASLAPRPLGEEPQEATPIASPVASPISTPVSEATPRG